MIRKYVALGMVISSSIGCCLPAHGGVRMTGDCQRFFADREVELSEMRRAGEKGRMLAEILAEKLNLAKNELANTPKEERQSYCKALLSAYEPDDAPGDSESNPAISTHKDAADAAVEQYLQENN